MAIKSHAFGRVTLTESDAEKFEKQVTSGRPKREALTSVKRGVSMARDLRETGKLTMTLKRD